MNSAAWLTDLGSSDDERVHAAIRELARRARTAPLAERTALGERILPLVERRSPKIRQAVADLVDVLPEACADGVLAALLVDRDPYVRRAAERASARRKQQQGAQAREDEHERVLGQILARIESRSGKSARRLAERAARLGLESFVRKLHHELGKVMMPLELALHRIDVELQAPQIDPQAIRRRVDGARELVAFAKSILGAAGACSATVHPSFEVACLAALVDEARAHLVARLTARAAARLAFTNDVDPTIRVEVDRHTLLQAFQNILQNGVEAYDGASDEASQPIAITVCSSSARQGAEVVLAFTDRGRGMSAEQLARAFIPFGSSKPGGTGVGMVVSRRMVEEVHGGTLTLESALGAGTTVRVALPALDRGARR